MKFARSYGQRLAAFIFLSLAVVACSGTSAQNSGAGQQPMMPTAVQHDTNADGQEETPASENTPAPGVDVGEGTTVNVVAQDFTFVLDSTTASAGAITFVVTNRGTMPHDFAITVNGEQFKTPLLAPGEIDRFTVELQTGSYDYLCTIPGHDILGMVGTFVVQ